MKALATSMIALAFACLTGSLARADEKIDKDKLIGTWKIVKADDAPIGATGEFTKDGKLIVVIEENGNKVSMQGTYALEGNKITIVLKKGDKDDKDTATIKSLSADKLVIENKNGKTVEFEKVKK